MERENWQIYLICYIPSFFIVIITFCLIFIYTKTKDLHSYPCYFNILLCSVIAIDNILRLIPFYDDQDLTKKPNDKFGCKFQGFSLSLFDKLMLTTITIYSIISFMGLVKNEVYAEYERCLFISLIIISFLISLFCSILFMLNGVTNYKDICYVKAEKAPDDDQDLKINKKIIDTIVTSILFVINVYCILHTLFYILKMIKDLKGKGENYQNNEKKIKKYYSHFWKFIINLIIISLTFIMVILIILDKFFTTDIITSLFYVLISLIIVIIFTINLRVLHEGKKIICCQKERAKSIFEEEDVDENEIEISNIKSEHLGAEE
jgi:hypothetical protein